jgi:hypothetical protein
MSIDEWREDVINEAAFAIEHIDRVGGHFTVHL